MFTTPYLHVHLHEGHREGGVSVGCGLFSTGERW